MTTDDRLNTDVSFGTNAIYKTIMTMGTKGDPVNVFVINIMTIIRNVLGYGEINTSDLVAMTEQVLLELRIMYTYLEAYAAIRNIPVHVIRYLHEDTFKILPEHVRRNMTKAHRLLEDVTKASTIKFAPNKLIPEAHGELNVHRLYISLSKSKRTYPHVLIPELITKQIMSYTKCTLRLISHIPIDFYMHEHYRRFGLINSHTGLTTEAKHLGEKVFGIPGLLLDRRLHLLFGDRVLVKGILRSKKRAIDELVRTKTHGRFTHNEAVTFLMSKHKAKLKVLKYNLP